MEVSRGRKGKQDGKKSERETNHERLLTLRDKLRVAGREVGGAWDNWVTGIEEGM